MFNPSDRNKVVYLAVIAAIAFCLGYEVDDSRKPSSETVKSTETQQFDTRQTHEHIETVVSKAPDGSSVETITKDVVIDSDRQKTTQKQSSVVVEAVKPKINLSVLGGYDINRHETLYGASASKEILGPVTLGVFGLSNSIVGVSVGIGF